MNKWIGAGNIVNDIELRHTGTGKEVVNFRIAVKDRYTKDKTDFIGIVAWGKTAKFISDYFKKGRKIMIEGRITTRNYESNGQTVYVTEILAENVDFADSKNKNNQCEGQVEMAETNDGFQEITDDILPF